jgi:hypothetical protein
LNDLIQLQTAGDAIDEELFRLRQGGDIAKDCPDRKVKAQQHKDAHVQGLCCKEDSLDFC